MYVYPHTAIYAIHMLFNRPPHILTPIYMFIYIHIGRYEYIHMLFNRPPHILRLYIHTPAIYLSSYDYIRYICPHTTRVSISFFFSSVSLETYYCCEALNLSFPTKAKFSNRTSATIFSPLFCPSLPLPSSCTLSLALVCFASILFFFPFLASRR
jgi:hypothetical protein